MSGDPASYRQWGKDMESSSASFYSESQSPALVKTELGGSSAVGPGQNLDSPRLSAIEQERRALSHFLHLFRSEPEMFVRHFLANPRFRAPVVQLGIAPFNKSDGTAVLLVHVRTSTVLAEVPVLAPHAVTNAGQDHWQASSTERLKNGRNREYSRTSNSEKLPNGTNVALGTSLNAPPLTNSTPDSRLSGTVHPSNVQPTQRFSYPGNFYQAQGPVSIEGQMSEPLNGANNSWIDTQNGRRSMSVSSSTLQHYRHSARPASQTNPNPFPSSLIPPAAQKEARPMPHVALSGELPSSLASSSYGASGMNEHFNHAAHKEPVAMIPAVSNLFKAQLQFERLHSQKEIDTAQVSASTGFSGRLKNDGQLKERFEAPLSESRGRLSSAPVEDTEMIISRLKEVGLESEVSEKPRRKPVRPRYEALRPPPRKPPRVSSRQLHYHIDGPFYPPPAQILISNATKSAYSLYHGLAPSPRDEQRRIKLAAHFRKLARSEFPGSNVFIYGSSATGLFLPGGDVDLCLEVPKGYCGRNGRPLSERRILRRFAYILKRARLGPVTERLRASVPILNLHDPVSDLDVDICLNNSFVFHNTMLIKNYLSLDARAKALAMVVKYWAHRRRINNTYHGTLSSYAYTMLVINYLQQLSPPVLPCLQKGNTLTKLSAKDPKVWFDKSITARNYRSGNTSSLGELVLGFYKFYSREFRFDKDVVSVRCGCLLDKATKDWEVRDAEDGVEEAVAIEEPEADEEVWEINEAQNGNDNYDPGDAKDVMNSNINAEAGHRFSVEDPFIQSHDLGRGIDEETLQVLREEFELAFQLIRTTGDVHRIGKEWTDRKVKLLVERKSPLSIDKDKNGELSCAEKQAEVELLEDDAVGSVLNAVWEQFGFGQVQVDKSIKKYPTPFVELNGRDLNLSEKVKNLRLKMEDILVVGLKDEAEKKENSPR